MTGRSIVVGLRLPLFRKMLVARCECHVINLVLSFVNSLFQGTFPNGIDIITNANYFTLSNRRRAYTEIAPKIALFSEYQQDLVGHVCEVGRP